MRHPIYKYNESLCRCVSKNVITIQFQEGTNVPHCVNDFRKETESNVQPYIVCVEGQTKDNCTFFVQADGWIISLHKGSNAVSAFDTLFKTFFVLNVEYRPTLINFYIFMECYIYKLNTTPASIVASVHANICYIKLM